MVAEDYAPQLIPVSEEAVVWLCPLGYYGGVRRYQMLIIDDAGGRYDFGKRVFGDLKRSPPARLHQHAATSNTNRDALV